MSISQEINYRPGALKRNGRYGAKSLQLNTIPFNRSVWKFANYTILLTKVRSKVSYYLASVLLAVPKALCHTYIIVVQ